MRSQMNKVRRKVLTNKLVECEQLELSKSGYK